MSSKTTHAEMRKNAAARCMNRVMWLLKWDELTYCWYKYEQGLRYLQLVVQDDAAVAEMERSPVYWGWWKNHWTIREEGFLSDIVKLEQQGFELCETVYKGLHRAELLAGELSAESAGMATSWASMIGVLFDDAKKQERLCKASK